MRLRPGKAFWLSAAAASAVALVVLARRRARRDALPVPAAYRTRIAGDASQRVAWRFDRRFRTLPAGKALRIETGSPALVHWSTNQWDSVEDTHTTEIARGVHVADLATEELPPGVRVTFTFYWPEVNRWEGEDFEIRIEAAARTTAP
ncbi:MAG TPA: hypothetical protein VHA11_07530 [Bryobacteraceae bacterium]|nr:hypothetical protein [Bryobacteraceae bacterium]